MTLPPGFRLRPDRRVRRTHGDTVLVGGMPLRMLRLTPAGATVASALLDGEPVRDAASGALARRLVDAGLAHPLPPEPAEDVEVVVPVYDDPRALDRCLLALAGGGAVTVVDDGSPHGRTVAAIAAAHGARLLRLDTNAGPAAARNAGLRAASADVVAFVDADVQVPVPTLRRLAAHLADPAVVAVAPRIRTTSTRRGRTLTALARSWSPLDLGPDPSLVGPGRRVPYVPSTVLVTRRAAVEAAGGFDERMRFGEDVDLVWRLWASGAQVRYDPHAVARHDEPTTWGRWLARRFTYGTSAAPLAARHGELMAPVTLRPAPLLSVVLALAGRRRAAAAVAAATAGRVQVRLRRGGVPSRVATVGAATAAGPTALAAARWATQLWWPLAVAAAARSPRARRPALVLAVAPPLVEWVRRRPCVDPVRWTGAVWADEVAYGLGVWRGCATERAVRAVRPRVR